MDCEETSFLFKDLDREALAQCFRSMKEPLTLSYVLDRSHWPKLILEDRDLQEGEIYSCVEKLLKEISVPREIFFMTDEPLTQSDEGGVERCMTSRLYLDSDRFLGVKFPGGGLAVEVTFPLSFLPAEGSAGAHDVERILLGWSLTPFFHETDGAGVLARRVTTRMCNKCFGRMYRPKPKVVPLTKTWPPEPASGQESF